MSTISIPRLKDTAILLGWICGLLLIGFLCWYLTQPLRANLLRDSVNRVFVRAGDDRRLGMPIAPSTIQPSLGRMGTWYTMNNGNRALVFSLIADGVFLPCAAIVNQRGILEDIIPLSTGGQKLLDRVSPGIKRLYIRRIEGGL